MLLSLVPRLFDWYLRFVDWTSRKIVLHEKHDSCKLRGDPAIFVSFHQGLIYFVHHFRDRGGMVMASQSRDGDLIASILSRLGYRCARGSDSRGGCDALGEMIAALKDEDISAGMVSDGPRGPYGTVKSGSVVLARESGLPLVPIACWTTRKRLLGNWDRTLIPLPFSRIYFAYGEPMRVPAEATWDIVKTVRRDLADRIQALVFEVQKAASEARQDFRPAKAASTV